MAWKFIDCKKYWPYACRGRFKNCNTVSVQELLDYFLGKRNVKADSELNIQVRHKPHEFRKSLMTVPVSGGARIQDLQDE